MIEENKELTKDDYWQLIKKIKEISENKKNFPTRNCCKSELIKWLLDHLGTFITIIPDL